MSPRRQCSDCRYRRPSIGSSSIPSTHRRGPGSRRYPTYTRPIAGSRRSCRLVAGDAVPVSHEVRPAVETSAPRHRGRIRRLTVVGRRVLGPNLGCRLHHRSARRVRPRDPNWADPSLTTEPSRSSSSTRRGGLGPRVDCLRLAGWETVPAEMEASGAASRSRRSPGT